jgi:hypothetical protein
MTFKELWDFDLRVSRKSKAIAAVCAFSAFGLFASLISVTLERPGEKKDRPIMNSVTWDRLELEAAQSYEKAHAMHGADEISSRK